MSRQLDSEDVVATSLKSLLVATGCRTVQEFSEYVVIYADLDGDCEIILPLPGEDPGIEVVVDGTGTRLEYPFRLSELHEVIEELDDAYSFDIQRNGLADDISLIEGFEVTLDIDYFVDLELVSDDVGRRQYSSGRVMQNIVPYPYRRALSGAKTFEEWRSGRFLRHYVGLSVDLPGSSTATTVTLAKLRTQPYSGMRRTSTTDSCPSCGGAVVEIVYGMPGPELFEEAEQGRVVLGGCLLPVHGNPTRSCPCGQTTDGRCDFGDLTEHGRLVTSEPTVSGESMV